jgi:hypothetical protein
VGRTFTKNGWSTILKIAFEYNPQDGRDVGRSKREALCKVRRGQKANPSKEENDGVEVEI